MTPVCPVCGSPDPYGLETGYLQYLHDIVLAWECSACSHRWPRFASGRLHQAGLAAIEDAAG